MPGRQIDEFPQLRREFGVAAERRNEFIAERDHLPYRHACLPDRYLDLLTKRTRTQVPDQRVDEIRAGLGAQQ